MRPGINSIGNRVVVLESAEDITTAHAAARFLYDLGIGRISAPGDVATEYNSKFISDTSRLLARLSWAVSILDGQAPRRFTRIDGALFRHQLVVGEIRDLQENGVLSLTNTKSAATAPLRCAAESSDIDPGVREGLAAMLADYDSKSG